MGREKPVTIRIQPGQFHMWQRDVGHAVSASLHGRAGPVYVLWGQAVQIATKTLKEEFL